jgi:hypothetical protein
VKSRTEHKSALHKGFLSQRMRRTKNIDERRMENLVRNHKRGEYLIELKVDDRMILKW